MLFNYLLGIYCFHCKKYYNPYTEVYLSVLYEESISCPENHLIGHTFDNSWKEYWREENGKSD
jgi:hypothetical protein